MAASCGKAKQVDEADEDSGRMERTHELPNNELPLQRVHAILDKMSAARDSSRADEQTARDETLEPEDLIDAKADQSQNVNNAMQLTAKLWARDASEWPESGVDARSMSLSKTPEQGKGKGKGKKKRSPPYNKRPT